MPARGSISLIVGRSISLFSLSRRVSISCPPCSPASSNVLATQGERAGRASVRDGSRAFYQVKRLGRKVRALHTSNRRTTQLKCDICDQEFANSEEVKNHKEQAHPMGEGDGEKPDLLENPGMKPEESEMPEPAEPRTR